MCKRTPTQKSQRCRCPRSLRQVRLSATAAAAAVASILWAPCSPSCRGVHAFVPTPKAGLRSGDLPTRRPEFHTNGLRTTGRRAISVMVSTIEGLQAKEQEADGVVASLGERVRGDFPILDQVRLLGWGCFDVSWCLGWGCGLRSSVDRIVACALVSYSIQFKHAHT